VSATRGERCLEAEGPKMTWLTGLMGAMAVGMLVLVSPAHAGEMEFRGFPFVIPPEGLVPGSAPAELAGLSGRRPAAEFVRVQGDRFVLAESGRPVRFWATNLCFGACFPPHDVAERMARRMASLGIRCVRFHHMDASGYPRGIWRNEGWGDFEHTDLHPEALDRLDYLVAQLKKNGIYVNLNLHVSRTYGVKDGFPAVGPGESVPRYGKGVDHFFPRCIEEQKRYARMLLRHVNAYTGMPYAEEPAVAIVEISNEDGLLREWRGGGLDHLPAPYVAELRRQWNEWLRRRYGSTDALRKAWSSGATPGSDEDLLSAPGVRASLQVAEDAKAELREATGPEGSRAVSIAVREGSPVSWHVQYMWAPFAVKKGATYMLDLKLRANRGETISVDCRMAREPWQNLGFSQRLELTPEWSSHRFYFTCSQDYPAARITLSGLAKDGLEISVADARLKLAAVSGLAPGEGLEQGVPWVSRRELSARTAAFRRDVVLFLRDTEAAYWRGMRDYLHGELGVKASVTGTAVGYTTPQIAAETADFVDSHAYWQHPRFPGRPWDPENWFVRQIAMVDHPDAATIGLLAARRVFGLPYTVTEYNHPTPNRYEAEGFPLIALYGALQGWDGVFSFTYASGETWESDGVSSYFNIAPNPVKLAVFPACADIFDRGRIGPAARVVPLQSGQDELVQWVLGGGSVARYPQGADPLIWQQARVGQAVEGLGVPSGGGGSAPDVKWTLGSDGKGLVTYRGGSCMGLIGFAAGHRLESGGVSLRPGPTSLDGFSVVMLNSLAGQPIGREGRYLLTAVCRCANAGMVWNEERNSVGRNWGHGPALCEGVPVELSVPAGVGQVRLYALRPDGTRGVEVKPEQRNGAWRFAVGPDYRTLWYELVMGADGGRARAPSRPASGRTAR